MRKLMDTVLGFSAGCLMCAYFSSMQIPIMVITAGAFLCAGLLLMSGDGKLLRSIARILLGGTMALLWYGLYSQYYLSPVRTFDGQIQPAMIRAADYSYDTTYGSAVDARIAIQDRSYQVKVYLKEEKTLIPGDTIHGEFLFRVTAPDAAEESLYHQGKGIFLLAYQRGEIAITSSEPTLLEKIAVLRRNIRETLEQCFPEDTASFSQALLLGDGQQLDYETDTAFKLSGIRHIIAVSGLHVSILFALISGMTFHKRFLTTLLGLPALFLFAALAGFTPSVCRACLMSGLMLLGMLAEKEYDNATSLAFAVLVMLLLNPLTVVSVSFQLSVGSVAGICLFELPVRKWLLSLFYAQTGQKKPGHFVSWLSSSAAVTISAMAFTAPLSALHFGSVSLIGVVTNLLVLWVISAVFYGILGVILLNLVSGKAAMLLARGISLLIRYILFLAKKLAAFPLAAIYTRSVYMVFWLIFVFLLLGVFLLMKKKRAASLISCGILGLCIALMASWLEPQMTDIRFSVLDVGQGQCLLMQYRGNNIMVDCGGDSDSKTADIAAETLLSQGIDTLDCMILTHLDRDHAGAVENLLTRVNCRMLILPAQPNGLQQSTAGETIYAAEDLEIAVDGLTVKIFTPDFPGNSNEMSLCILFAAENCDILITGDRNGFGERSLLRNHAIPDVDILIAGHHGSKNSTCEELLTAVKPELVCISVGADNSYGHPAPELLQRLADHGCRVYRTDRDGTILIRR